jgi:hypothetical protein
MTGGDRGLASGRPRGSGASVPAAAHALPPFRGPAYLVALGGVLVIHRLPIVGPLGTLLGMALVLVGVAMLRGRATDPLARRRAAPRPHPGRDGDRPPRRTSWRGPRPVRARPVRGRGHAPPARRPRRRTRRLTRRPGLHRVAPDPGRAVWTVAVTWLHRCVGRGRGDGGVDGCSRVTASVRRAGAGSASTAGGASVDLRGRVVGAGAAGRDGALLVPRPARRVGSSPA